MIRICCILCFLTTSIYAQVTTISGYVREQGSLEKLPGVVVSVEGYSQHTVSNTYGFYSLSLPRDKNYTILFSSVGYQKIEKRVDLKIETFLSVELPTNVTHLDEVTIKDRKLTEPGVTRLPIQQIKLIPALLGEKDVIKALQLLPGVQKATEGFTALYVRGGGPDQNLILLDEAPVYNANHLFGLFSTFNGDAIGNVSFWKGGFPARYGGRLSSVIDLKMKEGNKEKFHGEGGIGLLSSRLTVEGPISKGKSSYLISARRSYFDLISKPFMQKNTATLYNFFDINAKSNVELSSKDNLYFSGYFGHDKLVNNEESINSASIVQTKSKLIWGNATGTLRWNHQLNTKLFANTTLFFTNFNFDLTEDFHRRRDSISTGMSTSFRSSLQDWGFKTDFDYYPNNFHTIKSGFQFIRHRFKPRIYAFEDLSQKSSEENTEKYVSTEYSIYVEDAFKISNQFDFNGGIRLTGLKSDGKNYLFFEPRLTLNYLLAEKWSISASYSRGNQFIHLLSNTGIGLSTDLWVPTTRQTPPQQADQITAGISRKFPKNGLVFTVESFRKWLRNIIAYREGASFLAISDGVQELKWKDNVTNGKGWAYGTEFLLQKNTGKLTGWIGYTLSWTIHQFDDLNNGKRFFPRYDRRHDISIVGSYKISEKVRLSANWLYATGNSISAPLSYSFINYDFSANPTGGVINTIDYLGSRNSFRAEAYHRLDLSVQLLKKKRWGERSWEFGLYNAYSRKNPFYYYLKTRNDFAEKGQRTELVKKSLFPVIPSITYNFKF
ncbi:TonB-dependent receptor [Dyadobacter jiangsuensis]|uniref:Outer membrane receptor protein involved in Fe transport n=1 Tax=Dyadobacter jiangsuensis TaxID=1591085 RepID=A0A2P8F8N4_9BACT|nr:TonB-dependent receptor [Dyadobacter jiangsuensis]PSL18065.1 outer membrane receptor protein involved in Fe transport [Dyadobacter jiangsuensis]